MDFAEYQQRAAKTDETKKAAVSLYGLAGEVGSIFSVFKKRTRDRQGAPAFKAELTEELGDALWYISNIASLHEISLAELAEENLKKASSLFEEGAPPRFDEGFPAGERFPRHLRVEFTTDPRSGRSQMLHEGAALGNSLSDNVMEEDYYRFHDVFHLSFMAFLGWSPVMRSLLRCKRKSDPTIDENEDGARAAITEEAISAIIFNAAEEHDFFPDPKSIRFGLLRTVAHLAKKFEVQACSLRQWRQAIWTACRVYSELRNHQGGIVEVDLDEAAVDFLGPPPAPASERPA